MKLIQLSKKYFLQNFIQYFEVFFNEIRKTAFAIGLFEMSTLPNQQITLDIKRVQMALSPTIHTSSISSSSLVPQSSLLPSSPLYPLPTSFSSVVHRSSSPLLPPFPLLPQSSSPLLPPSSSTSPLLPQIIYPSTPILPPPPSQGSTLRHSSSLPPPLPTSLPPPPSTSQSTNAKSIQKTHLEWLMISSIQAAFIYCMVWSTNIIKAPFKHKTDEFLRNRLKELSKSKFAKELSPPLFPSYTPSFSYSPSPPPPSSSSPPPSSASINLGSFALNLGYLLGHLGSSESIYDYQLDFINRRWVKWSEYISPPLEDVNTDLGSTSFRTTELTRLNPMLRDLEAVQTQLANEESENYLFKDNKIYIETLSARKCRAFFDFFLVYLKNTLIIGVDGGGKSAFIRGRILKMYNKGEFSAVKAGVMGNMRLQEVRKRREEGGGGGRREEMEGEGGGRRMIIINYIILVSILH